MIDTKVYIEALDTLIEYYKGEISKLEKIKQNVIGKSTGADKEEYKPAVERHIISESEYYDIMRSRVIRRIRYSDGTYEDVLED